ncbi:MAG TPA: 50S ribosomal protein L24 [Bacteroidales bacterium]|nr:50S ribosomal protein L24 [Bacteroidales bacterium]
MKRKFHIRKGDTVMVIAGDSKGQQGRVLKVDTDSETAIVEGINMISKHSRPSTQNPKGGIVHKEAPIHISNLKVVDSSGKPTRTGRKIDAKTNKTVRYSIKSGEVIK